MPQHGRTGLSSRFIIAMASPSTIEGIEYPESHISTEFGIVWLLGGQMGLEGSHKLIHLHRPRHPGNLQAGKTGLLRGVAAVRFVPQTDPGPPLPHRSSHTDHRAIP